MKITKQKFYGGSMHKVSRLGISILYLELQNILIDTEILLLEEKDANGAAEVRKAIDRGFENNDEWAKSSSGGIDWIKRIRYNQSIVSRLGVEVQVSARSDLLIRDIVHIRNHLQNSEIDVGVIVVPSDTMQHYLPDRTPSYRDAIRYIEQEFPEVTKFPLIVMAIEHDGPGPALKKMKRKS